MTFQFLSKFGMFLGAMSFLITLIACQPAPPVNPTPIRESTESKAVALARQTLQDYYAFLQAGEFEQAAELLLPLTGFDRRALAEAARQASLNGWRIEAVQFKEEFIFDPERVIFRVSVQQQGAQPETYEMYQVVHLLDGKSWISSGVLGEYTLTTSPVTHQRMSLVPLTLHHGVDYYQIWLLAQNDSAGSVRWSNLEPCAILTVENEQINAECTDSAMVIEAGTQATLVMRFPLPEGTYPRRALPTILKVNGFSSDSFQDEWSYQFSLKYAAADS